jgi:hypothetical protein
MLGKVVLGSERGGGEGLHAILKFLKEMKHSYF